jgi:hypothetical protein
MKQCLSLTNRICVANLDYRIHCSDWEHILEMNCILCVQSEKSLRECWELRMFALDKPPVPYALSMTKQYI